jgi:hypothetical protein
MKQLIFCSMLVFLMTRDGFSQVGPTAREKEQSNIEKFSSQSGTLFKKEFKKIGLVGDVEFQVLTITDLLTNKKTSGIKASKEVHKSYGSDTKDAFLDYDEIDALIKAITTLKKYPNTIPSNYTEIGFASRGGFQLTMFVSGGKWDIAMKLEKYDSDSYEFLEYSDLDRINDKIWDAKKYIDAAQTK